MSAMMPHRKKIDDALTRLTAITDEIAALMDEQRIILTALDLRAGLLEDVDLTSLRAERGVGSILASIRDAGASERLAIARGTKMVRLDAVMELTGKTKRTIYRWMDLYEFPRPTIIKKAAYWNARDVGDWWETNKENVGRWPAI